METEMCVEADSTLVSKIKQLRPNDIVINAGWCICRWEGEDDFYIFDVPAINTFNKVEMEERKSSGRHRHFRTVKVSLLIWREIHTDTYMK